jgi:hypothetical protein
LREFSKQAARLKRSASKTYVFQVDYIERSWRITRLNRRIVMRFRNSSHFSCSKMDWAFAYPSFDRRSNRPHRIVGRIVEMGRNIQKRVHREDGICPRDGNDVLEMRTVGCEPRTEMDQECPARL